MMAFSKSWVVTFYLFILLRCNYERIHDHRLWYTKSNKTGVFFFAGRGPPKVVKFHVDTQNDAICEAGDAFSPSIFGESPGGVGIIYRTGPPRPMWFTRSVMLVILGLNRSWILGIVSDTICVYKAICNMIILHSLLDTTHYQPFYWVGF